MANKITPSFARLENSSPLPAAERQALLSDLGFGRVFTDHMAVVRFSADRGWHEPRVEPRSPIPLDPAAAVLHYAQEIFEGLKAYRTADGGVALFRPESNAHRFQASAERLSMPALPEDLFHASLHALIEVDRDWIPEQDGAALYLRPFMFASEAFLGVRPAREYLYVVIASPVGSYFKSGSQPIAVWASEHFSRAAPGGTGAAKCGGNYSSSLLPYAEATANGCDQAVFLDSLERRWIEELGGMNIFFVFEDGSLVTPPLSGTILPGITRDSLMVLARDMGLEVREEQYSLLQWREDVATGRLREAFACGTAAVVSSIGRVRGTSFEFVIGDGGSGPVGARLRAELVGIQKGTGPDRHGWVTRLATP